MHEIVMPFDSRVVEVVRDVEDNPWVSVRSVCRNIGIDSKNQIEKLKANPTYKGVSYRLTSATLKNLLGEGIHLVPLEVKTL
jgi:hypothetical protein